MREPKQAKNLKRFVESLAKEERPIENSSCLSVRVNSRL